jgi:hypothetical protein
MVECKRTDEKDRDKDGGRREKESELNSFFYEKPTP